MPKLSDYLTVKDAAEYLGVSPNTPRNWGRDGKITERGHPANGYRLHATEELDAFLRKVARPDTRQTRRKPK